MEKVNLSESIAIFHEGEEPLEEVNVSDSLVILYDNSIHYVIDKTPRDKVYNFSVDSDSLAISYDNSIHYVLIRAPRIKFVILMLR